MELTQNKEKKLKLPFTERLIDEALRLTKWLELKHPKVWKDWKEKGFNEKIKEEKEKAKKLNGKAEKIIKKARKLFR